MLSPNEIHSTRRNFYRVMRIIFLPWSLLLTFFKKCVLHKHVLYFLLSFVKKTEYLYVLTGDFRCQTKREPRTFGWDWWRSALTITRRDGTNELKVSRQEADIKTRRLSLLESPGYTGSGMKTSQSRCFIDVFEIKPVSGQSEEVWTCTEQEKWISGMLKQELPSKENL